MEDNDKPIDVTDEAEITLADRMLQWKLRYNLTQEQVEEIADDIQGCQSSVKAEFWKLHGLIERGHLTLRSYVRKGGNRDMAERCLWLWLGFPTLAGGETLADIVRLINQSKAAVNKCVQHFQKECPELPKLPGQRDELSRRHMKEARIKQLDKKKETK